ncbi:MAG: hypothetical protein HGGPFJEG_01447 [Ignavibacteria bacterium]|nr:hypothetical protein [Ignavibacteria bacterium]
MKTLKLFLISIVLFLSAITSPAQDFKILAEAGQGFRWQGFDKPLIYIFNTSLKTTYSLWQGKLQAGTTEMVVYYDTEVELYAGARFALKVFSTNLKTIGEDFNISITGEALYGTSGRKLFGGGTMLRIDPLTVSLNLYQEYEHKELWLSGGIGYNIDYLFNK